MYWFDDLKQVQNENNLAEFLEIFLFDNVSKELDSGPNSALQQVSKTVAAFAIISTLRAAMRVFNVLDLFFSPV